MNFGEVPDNDGPVVSMEKAMNVFWGMAFASLVRTMRELGHLPPN